LCIINVFTVSWECWQKTCHWSGVGYCEKERKEWNRKEGKKMDANNLGDWEEVNFGGFLSGIGSSVDDNIAFWRIQNLST
jgi:hypothetical protein